MAKQTDTVLRKFYTVYDPPKHDGLVCPEKGETKQSFKDECDVNNILKLYEQTGQLPDLIKQNAQYGDFSDVVGYQEALNTVMHAQEQFEALSSAVRERFNNDPAKFLAFMEDEKNVDEAVRMGLATARADAGGANQSANNQGSAGSGKQTSAAVEGTGGHKSGG